MSLDELRSAIKTLPEEDQLRLLAQIVRDFLGKHPDQEIAVLNDQREPVAFCVPNALYRPYLPPEKLAEMKERAKNPGPLLTTAQLLAKLEEAAREQEQAAASVGSR